jgi:hypothetical protein
MNLRTNQRGTQTTRTVYPTKFSSKAFFTQHNYSLPSFRYGYIHFPKRISQEETKPIPPGALALPALSHWEALSLLVTVPRGL